MSAGTGLPASFYTQPFLIVGGGREALEDVARARALWPDALLIGLNHVALHMRCHGVFSVHQKNIHDLYRSFAGITVMSCARPYTQVELEKMRKAYPRIDLYLEKRGGFTSAPAAVWGLLRMFHVKHLALCGVSLSSGGYFYEPEAVAWTDPNTRRNTIDQLEKVKAEFSEAPIVGMSGASREIFGGPDGSQ